MADNDRSSFTGIVGVGIDLIVIQEIKELDERTRRSFTDRTFTQNEKDEAESLPDPYEYYSGRYAVKEAVYKAIASRCSEPFDFRMVETLSDADGKPHVTMNPEFRKVCEDAGIKEILISISHEGGFSIAIEEAVGER